MGAGEPEAHQILHPGNGREGMRSRGTGDLLIVFKAMKMNNNIKATFAGKVKKIDVKEGDNIPNHALMIEME